MRLCRIDVHVGELADQGWIVAAEVDDPVILGPAGTGKTYLAVACAVDALEREQIRRILLVRPAVEAGEKLGFLPGDLSQKIDPYLRPLYDALYEMLGFEYVAKLIERQVIEVAPLAYICLLYTSPSPRDATLSRMPSSA